MVCDSRADNGPRISRLYLFSFGDWEDSTAYLQHSHTIMAAKHWLSAFIKSCTVLAVAIQQSQAAAIGPLDLPLSLSSTSTHTNTTSLNDREPECRALIYGDPRISSCGRALALMPEQIDLRAYSLFSQRPPNPLAQKTSPWRTISRKSWI